MVDVTLPQSVEDAIQAYTDALHHLSVANVAANNSGATGLREIASQREDDMTDALADLRKAIEDYAVQEAHRVGDIHKRRANMKAVRVKDLLEKAAREAGESDG